MRVVIAKRCSYVSCIDGVKVWEETLWLKSGLLSKPVLKQMKKIIMFYQRDPGNSLLEKLEVCDCQELFVSKCRLYWMEWMNECEDSWIMSVVEVGEILRMTVMSSFEECRSNWISVVSSKAATR